MGISELSVFKYFDLEAYANVKTFHVSPGFEISVKISNNDSSVHEFVLVLSHYPSLTYLAFVNKDAIDFLVKLPSQSMIEKGSLSEGEIFLSLITVGYEINDKRCRLTLERNGCELKQFALRENEYSSLKGLTYDVTLMYEQFVDSHSAGSNW